MSTVPATIPTEALAATDPTAVTETVSGFESIKEMMDAFDPAALLPDLSGLPETIASIARFAVLAGPVILLIMGLAYLFLSPKEANYRFGYRCYHGMGSVEAWRYTQRMAGLIWGVLGLALTCVMFFVTGGYGSAQTVDVIDSAITCLIWEIVLALLSCLVINILVMLSFDRNGGRRRK